MSARRLWADRHARRYLSGQALSLLGDSAMWLACGIWVRTLTGSNAAAALTFLFFIAPALLAPAAGLLVDRVRRRPLLIVANVAGAAMLAPLLLVNDRGDVWLIYTVMALYGFLNVLIAPAQSALLAAILPADLLADANATLRTVQEGLRIAAPLAGAGLFTLLGGHAVVLLDMLTFIGATLFLLALPNDQLPNDQPPNDQPPNDQRLDDQRLDDQAPDDQPQRETLRRSIAAGFRFIGSTAALRRLTLAGAVASAGLGLGDATVYAIITDGLHRAPAFAGVTQFVQGIGAVAGGLCAAAAIRRLGEVRVVVAGLALLAIAPPVMATPFLAPALAGQLAIGTAIPLIVIAVITLLQRLAPMRLQGRVYAAFEVAVTGPQTAGLAIGAALVGVVDYRLILAGEAVLLALSTVLLARQAAREPRDRATSDAREEPVPAP